MIQRLKLLIVDDEKYIRNLLKINIDWNSLDIDICGEASCAEEGLQLVDELQPNIIISDICMDYMDGIEFSKIIKTHYPYTKIILLSGHNEFKYAKRGIEAGVSAYLLKPLEEEKIREVIISLKQAIYQETEKDEELINLKNYLNYNRNFLINNYLNALILPNADIHSAIWQLTYLDVAFQTSFFQIVIFSLNIESDENKQDSFPLTVKCNQILKELLKPQSNTYIFYDLNHQNILLSNNPHLNLLSQLENIKISLLERLGCNITIGIGQPCNTIKDLRNSYLSALDATHYRIILGNNQIIQYNYLGLKNESSKCNLEDEIAAVITSVKSCNFETAYKIIDSCISQQLNSDARDIIPVKVIISTIVNHLTHLLIQNNLRDTDSFSYCIAANERIFRLETIQELRNMTINLISSIIETQTHLLNNQNNDLINSVLEYLEDNYQNSQITLSSTAKKFFVNSSYLSRLFSQKNNQTFSKFLIELRLKKAAELLISTNLKSYEIATDVGFNDAKYFNKSFKNYYSVTTSEYRLTNMNGK